MAVQQHLLGQFAVGAPAGGRLVRAVADAVPGGGGPRVGAPDGAGHRDPGPVEPGEVELQEFGAGVRAQGRGVPVGHRVGVHFSPLRAMPATNCRWAMPNSTRTGSTETSAPAMRAG